MTLTIVLGVILYIIGGCWVNWKLKWNDSDPDYHAFLTFLIWPIVLVMAIVVRVIMDDWSEI